MIKGPRMNVRSEEGAETRQAGWHRRNDFSDLSQQKNWDGSFELLSKSPIWVTATMLQPSIVASKAMQGWVTAIAQL